MKKVSKENAILKALSETEMEETTGGDWLPRFSFFGKRPGGSVLVAWAISKSKPTKGNYATTWSHRR